MIRYGTCVVRRYAFGRAINQTERFRSLRFWRILFGLHKMTRLTVRFPASTRLAAVMFQLKKKKITNFPRARILSARASFLLRTNRFTTMTRLSSSRNTRAVYSTNRLNEWVRRRVLSRPSGWDKVTRCVYPA